MFWVRTDERAFIEPKYLESLHLEPSWNYMVEHLFLHLKTAKTYDGQLLKTNYELIGG